MSAAAEQVQRFRMSWEDYLKLPEKPKAEFVDGEVLVMAPTSAPHGSAVSRLTAVLLANLPDLEPMTEVGLQLPRNRLRVPDLMLVRDVPKHGWITDPPVLVAEVLSPSTRSEDTVRKSTEYADGGIGQYWLVDPDHRAIDIYANHDGAWDLLAHLDDDNPRTEVTVAGRPVPVDLHLILRGS